MSLYLFLCHFTTQFSVIAQERFIVVIAFHHNCHHPHLTSAGGKDLSNDIQLKVIGLIGPELCMKMLKNWSEKLKAKFPACLDDAFSVLFKREASPVEGQSLQQKDRKRRKGKAKKV